MSYFYYSPLIDETIVVTLMRNVVVFEDKSEKQWWVDYECFKIAEFVKIGRI